MAMAHGVNGEPRAGGCARRPARSAGAPPVETGGGGDKQSEDGGAKPKARWWNAQPTRY